MKPNFQSFLLLVFLVAFAGKAFSFPLIKKEREIIIEVDSSRKTVSELHIYSYPMANNYGLIGTYTELFVFNFQKVLIYKNQKSMTIPYLSCPDDCKVKQKRTTYDKNGEVVLIEKTVRGSEDFVIKKEKKISFSEEGQRSVQNHMLDLNGNIKGYQKPSKMKLMAHRIHSKKA